MEGSIIGEDLSFLDHLNPEQREAATYTGGPLLILAGAGSGKTRCLTYRFVYLVRHFDLRPSEVLAITFTNKAAREMRERIERLLAMRPGGRPAGDRAASGLAVRPGLGSGPRSAGQGGLWVSTFHSTSAQLLRRFGRRIGLDPGFTIYDADDQLALMRDVVAREGWDESRWPPAGLLAAVGRAKDELLGPGDLAARARDLREERAAKAYALYQDRLAANNAVDFDDLIFRTVVLLREHADVLADLRETWKHVLVDEYQDTNHAQYVFASLLAAGHRNLCVVGDDDQSIYRWRGADVRNVLEFEKDFPDAKTIRLERNYRSTKTILSAANGVIVNNRHRKGKTLWTENEAGDPVIYYLADDEREEAEFVAGEIAGGHRSRGLAYRSFAVLYRTHAQSRAFEDVFVRKAIPYQIVGGLRFYERKEIKDVLAYLRVVENPADEVSLERALGAPRRGIGPQTLAKLREMAEERLEPSPADGGPRLDGPTFAGHQGRLGLLGAIGLVAKGRGAEGAAAAAAAADITGAKRKELARFFDLITSLADRRGTMSVTQMVREIEEKSGLSDALRREGTPEALSRLENIRELASVAASYAEESQDDSLAGFLETASLLADIDVLKDGDDGVVMMTMHNAKGLEFPYVFVVGMEEGLFPHWKSAEEEGGLEEERRLCYVAMTRAMKRLYVTHARQRLLYGRIEPAAPSTFLTEIPKETLFVASLTADPSVAEGGGVGEEGRGRYAARPSQASDRPARTLAAGAVRCPVAAKEGQPRFVPGERVLHAKWGEGVVVGLNRVGERPGFGGTVRLRVAFTGQGVQTVGTDEVERKKK